MSKILDNNVLTPQEYSDRFLDRTRLDSIEELRDYLDDSGYDDVFDFCLLDTDEALRADNNIVLVLDPDTSEARWFEVWDKSYLKKYLSFGGNF